MWVKKEERCRKRIDRQSWAVETEIRIFWPEETTAHSWTNDGTFLCLQVYISCSVMMCKAGENGTRCSRGCTNSTSGSVSRRAKREALSQTSIHFISQGPLRLRRSAQLSGDPGTNTDRFPFALYLPCFRLNSNCASLLASDEPRPEPEPCSHRWMSSCSCGHGQCSRHVQGQDLQGQIPTSDLNWELDNNVCSVLPMFECIRVFWLFLQSDIGSSVSGIVWMNIFLKLNFERYGQH